MILRHKSLEWLEPSIGSDIGMRFGMWSFGLAIRDFAFFKHRFLCKNRLVKRVFYLLIFAIQENLIFLFVILDLLFFLFVNHARDPPCMTLSYCVLQFYQK